MPESTVGQSIIGALGNIAGISGRRAEDGLTAARSEELALKNKATKLMLQDDEDATMLGEFEERGYLTVDPKTGQVTADIEKLAADPTALARLINPEAGKFFSTKTADGKSPVSIAGVKKIDPRLLADPALGAYPDESGPAPAGSSKYVIQLRTPDGRIVPATQNASAAADDSLITLDEQQLSGIVQGRLARMKARGALDNNATMSKLNLAYMDASDAALQAKLMDMGPDKLTDEPAAARSLYDLVGRSKGEQLNEIARDYGIDPEEARKEAEDKWLKDQVAARKKIPLNTEDMSAYENTKELLTNQVARLDSALADYDRSRKGTAEDIDKAMIAMSLAESGRIGSPKKAPVSKDTMNRTGANPNKTDATRAKIVAEREAAAKQLAALKPPQMKALASGAPMPKFEWNEDNLRDSIRGKIDEAPSAEQTALLAKYAKDQGVQAPQDLAKIPDRNDALAIAWVIASNARGATAEQKVGIFDKLANYARTGDSAKSPIDANVAVSNARVNQANAITNANQVNASIANNNADNEVAWAKINLDAAKYDSDKTKDLWSMGKDMDAATNKVGETMDVIYKGTLGEDNKFNQTGPTRDAMAAWKKLRRDNEALPLGTPQQVATSKAYLEGFFQMAAAQSQVPGQAAWWDWTKHLANMFFREDAMVNMSPLINTARIEYANGKPERISFTEHAGSGKEVKAVVGAKEFERFTGGEDFTTFVKAVHSQQAINLLQAKGIPVTPANIQQAVGEVRKATGMDQ